MGLFNKIKNILFEADEEEIEEIPVYTKEEKAVVREEPVVTEVPKIEEELINSNTSYFSNIKRDIDYSYDEVDVLAEVPGSKVPVNTTYEEPVVTQEPVQKEEKKSPFLTFDEDEFERLNSRINKNESRIKKDREKDNYTNIQVARKTNSNFSATSTSNSNERVGSSSSRKFTPSLVISPVYGVLNKNYTKEDIVDKKDGMKREIVKPIVRKEIVKEEQPIEMPQRSRNGKVDIDSVRKKAFGDDTNFKDFDKDVINVKEKDIIIEDTSINIIEDELEFPKPLNVSESINKNSNEYIQDYEKIDVSNEILDEIEDEKSIEVNEVIIEDSLPFINEDSEAVVDEKVVDNRKIDKSKILDDLEKTSTLQILDDIERELNSIKPITNDYDEEDEEEKVKIERNDTLENDLFNLIDSMYEEGEEEEND